MHLFPSAYIKKRFDMKEMTISSYDDIDWLQLWKNHRESKSWTSKGAKEWDQKAAGFSTRTLNSPYVPLFLARLPLHQSYTVLDVGCGPGTLALPIAEKVKKVTAIDYSKNMINLLDQHARDRNLSNITTHLCSWEQDWNKLGIEPADITIASRSMNVENLPMAIEKLHGFTKKYAFISDRISPSPFDPDAFRAIGRDFNSGPDYIFTLNMLYSKKIHPFVEILALDNTSHFETFDEALSSYIWMFKDLTSPEEAKLKEYVSSIVTPIPEGGMLLTRKHVPQWAMIWWKKER